MHTLLPFLVLSLLITASAASPITSHRKSSPKSKAHEGQQPPKYFHEAGGSLELGHYDARYFKGEVPYEAHGPALRHLIRSWLATARGLGVETETWLAHGTLLGWWWSGRVMPWDYDLDVQMPTATLAYLLDVNPHHTDVGRGNGHNIIDARWIDVSNGLFIDITGLAERDPAGSPGVWSCKNAHKYRTAELYPVRHTEFEGVPASVPYAFDKILTDEYGSKSLVNTEWAGHHWAPELKEWVKDPDLPPEDEETKLNKQQQGSEAVVVVVEKTVMKGASKRDP